MIAIVLGIEGVQAIPIKQLTEAKLARPGFQRILTWFERTLNAVGDRTDREAIGGHMIAASAALVAARSALLAPFGPFFQYTGSNQQWALFITASRECFRIHVDGQRLPAAPHTDTAFHSIYSAHELDRASLGPVLTYRRVRGIYDPRRLHGPAAGYEGVVRMIAHRLFDRDPGLQRVRVRMERLYVGDRGTAPQTLLWEHERVEERAQP